MNVTMSYCVTIYHRNRQSMLGPSYDDDDSGDDNDREHHHHNDDE